tara:strand:- start:1062 stop:1697 length:636 start_codon:yes stop_codon:yes gene_type:complete
MKIAMIRVKGNAVSEAYANYCAKSWARFPTFKIYDAVTPATLSQQSGLMFKPRGNGKEMTDTEKACMYSQYNLWKKCAIEEMPILVLEHDAWLVNKNAIVFNDNLDVQFFGQHAMEAVLYHPRFAKRLMRHTMSNEVSGPMMLVDQLVGYFNKGTQSRHALPHARYMGKHAPVRSVLDPNVGTTVSHGDMSTADRLAVDRDLFKIIDLGLS